MAFLLLLPAVSRAAVECSSIFNGVSIHTKADAYDSPFDNSWQISTSVKGKF